LYIDAWVHRYLHVMMNRDCMTEQNFARGFYSCCAVALTVGVVRKIAPNFVSDGLRGGPSGKKTQFHSDLCNQEGAMRYRCMVSMLSEDSVKGIHKLQ
jgi:hypothetical protein